MLRKLTVYFLLASFTVVFTDREIWHSHENSTIEHFSSHHDAHEHDHDDSPFNEFKEICFQCDYQLDEAPQVLTFNYNFRNKQSYVHEEALSYIVAQEKVDTDQLRGPPSV